MESLDAIARERPRRTVDIRFSHLQAISLGHKSVPHKNDYDGNRVCTTGRPAGSRPRFTDLRAYVAMMLKSRRVSSSSRSSSSRHRAIKPGCYRCLDTPVQNTT
ncbi:hypothetical protein ACS0PU_005998 [Formica fusca]